MHAAKTGSVTELQLKIGSFKAAAAAGKQDGVPETMIFKPLLLA